MRIIQNLLILTGVCLVFVVIGYLIKDQSGYDVLFSCGWIAYGIYDWIKVNKDK